MPKRALIEHRPWLLASVVAACAYYFLWNNPVGEIWLILLKGAGVGLLAVYAAVRARGVDGKLLVAVLVFAALADMALVLFFEIGGALFAVSHCVAVVFYLRNRRESAVGSQKALAAVLLVGTPLIAWLLSGDALIAIYGVTLGAMAASAWLSRFSRYRVGIGAVLFVLSDLLIFSRLGPVDLGSIPDILIWPLYYIAQVMIATGVVQALRQDRPRS